MKRALGMLLVFSSCSMPKLGKYTDELFSRHDLDVPGWKEQVAVSGRFSGGGEEVAVLSRGKEWTSIQVHAFDGAEWRLEQETTLPWRADGVEVARGTEHDQLVIGSAEGWSLYDRDEGLVRELSSAPTLGDRLSHHDVARDLNGDGFEDLALPTEEGFEVWLGAAGGFTHSLELSGTAGIHSFDANRDGLSDLAYWNGSELVVRPQVAGNFGPEQLHALAVPFDSDNAAFLAAPEEASRRKKDHGLGGEIHGRILHSIADVNADGVEDLILFGLESGTIFGEQSLYATESVFEIHYGTVTDHGIEFAAEPSARAVTDGIPFSTEAQDFDDDGCLDFTVSYVNPTMDMALVAILGGPVQLGIDFHCLREDGTFSKFPTDRARAEVDPHRESGEEAAHFPAVRVGDVDGDGISDLVLGHSAGEIEVFPGVEGKELFAAIPHRIAITLPEHERHVQMLDWNGDGKQDLIVLKPGQRVSLLLAR